MRASACAAAIYDSSFMGNWLASSLGLRASPFVQSLRGGVAFSVIARSAAFSVIARSEPYSVIARGHNLFCHCEGAQPILSLRGGAAHEAISSQHEMTQLSYMQFLSAASMLDTEPAVMVRQFYVYILTNKAQTVLYTGITNDLEKRVWEHRSGLGSKFVGRYGVSRLVYFEVFEDPYEAISREKQIKAGPRRKKVALIEKANPRWRNLAGEL